MSTKLVFGKTIKPLTDGVTFVPRDGSDQGLPQIKQKTDSVPELSNVVEEEPSDDKQRYKATAILPEQSINDKQQDEGSTLLPEPVLYSQEKRKEFVDMRIGSTECPEEEEKDFQDLRIVNLRIGSVKSPDEAEKGFLDLKSASSKSNHSSKHKVKVGDLKTFRRFVGRLPEKGTHGLFTGKRICQPVDGSYSEGFHYHKVKPLVTSSDVGVFRDKQIKQLFIRKQVPKQNFNKNECIIPVMYNHPNIVEIFGVIQREGQMNTQVEIFMEDAGPKLSHFMVKNFPFLDDDVWSVIYQGVSALEYLHRHGVIHLDIKPDNLCISGFESKLRLKIIDFGSAKLSCQTVRVLGWTPEYMSPESCRYDIQERTKTNFNMKATDITPKVDIFAFGLTIAYILTGFHVQIKTVHDAGSYGGLTKHQRDIVRRKIIQKMAVEGEGCLTEQLKRIWCSDELKALLSRMCCPADVRWTSGDILKFLEARESNKAGHRQMNQLQQAPLKEANKDGTDCKKRKAPCQTVGLDSSISMFQSSQDHNPAINHQIARESKATNEQVLHQNQYTYPYEASTSSTRISHMARDPSPCRKRIRVTQELQLANNLAQESSKAINQNSVGREETTGQLQPIPHFNLPNTVAQLLQEAPDPGVRNPAIMKKLQDKISRNKGKPRVSGSVMPVPRMAPEKTNGTRSALIRKSQESSNTHSDGSGQDFGGDFADGEPGDGSQLQKRFIPNFEKIDN